MRIPTEITSMNRGQMLVLVIGGLASAYVLINRFIIPDDCLGRMCPANDMSWIWQVGGITAACVVAYWLLKNPSEK